jgi:hypothetical protein
MIGLVLDFGEIIAMIGIDLDTSNWCLFPYYAPMEHTDIPASEISVGFLIFGFTYFKYDFAGKRV